MRNIVRDILASSYDVNRTLKAFRKLLMIIAVPAVMVVTVFTFLGEGYTYQALRSYYQSYRLLSAVENIDYDSAAEYVHFYGFNEDKETFDEALIVEERLAYKKDLKGFFKEGGRTLMDHKIINYRTTESHTQGIIELHVKEKGSLYRIGVEVHEVEGKLAPYRWAYAFSDLEDDKNTEVIADKLIQAMATYMPEEE